MIYLIPANPSPLPLWPMSIIGVVLRETDLIVFADHAAAAIDPASPYGVRVLPDRDKLFLDSEVAVAVAGLCGVTDGVRELDLILQAGEVLTEHGAGGPQRVAESVLKLFNNEATFVRKHGEFIGRAEEEFGRPGALAVAIVAGMADGRPVAFTVAMTTDGPCLVSTVDPVGIGLGPAGAQRIIHSTVVDAALTDTVEDRVTRLDHAVADVFVKHPGLVSRRWSYVHLERGVPAGKLVTLEPKPFTLPRGA